MMASSNEIVRRDHQAPKLPRYIRTAFLDRMDAVFRKINDSADGAAMSARVYGAELSKFSESVLERAATEFIRTRTDAFFPTVAECLAVCRRIEHWDRKISGKDDLNVSMLRAKEWDELNGIRGGAVAAEKKLHHQRRLAAIDAIVADPNKVLNEATIAEEAAHMGELHQNA